MTLFPYLFSQTLVQSVLRQEPYHHSSLFLYTPDGSVYTFYAMTQIDLMCVYLTQGSLTLAGGFCDVENYILPYALTFNRDGVLKNCFNIITAPFCHHQAMAL